MKKPLVSILMLTYNHEKYIGQAIGSVLMQNVGFEYEIVIGEDCSRDKTRDEILRFSRKAPDKFRLILRNNNLGMLDNLVDLLSHCNGKYIAWLEGDDYWTDPLKLQKQVDFLESHPDHGLVHTTGDIVDESSGRIRNNVYRVEANLDKASIFNRMLLWEYRIVSCSVMFRRNLYEKYVDFSAYPDLKMGDTPIFLEFAYHAKIGYLDEPMFMRRHLSESASRTKSKIKKSNFSLSNNEMRLFFARKYNSPVNIQDRLELAYYRSLLANNYLKKEKSGSNVTAIQNILKSEKSIKKVLYFLVIFCVCLLTCKKVTQK